MKNGRSGLVDGGPVIHSDSRLFCFRGVLPVAAPPGDTTAMIQPLAVYSLFCQGLVWL